MAIFYPDSKVRLISGVPFDNRYVDQRLFTSKQEQYNYFNQKVVQTLDETTYIKHTVSSIRVPYEADTLVNVDYMMFQNSNYTDKWWYAFVTQIEYVNPNCSNIYFEIDVFQTFQFDLTYLDSYVVRCHQARFQNGIPLINTIPEDLNAGSEYRTIGNERFYANAIDDNHLRPLKFLIITSKYDLTHELNSDSYLGTGVGGTPAQLHYYIWPFIPGTDPGSPTVQPFQTVKVGGNVMGDIRRIFQYVSTSETFVGSIVSLTISDFIPCKIENLTDYNDFNIFDTTVVDIGSDGTKRVLEYVPTNDFWKQQITFPKYNLFGILQREEAYKESKLWMYPYSYLKISDKRGNEAIIRPEYVDGLNLNLTILSCISTQTKNGFIPTNYLMPNGFLDAETYLNKGFISMPNSSVTILDSYTASYLQSNRNMDVYQKTKSVMDPILNGGINGSINTGGVFGSLVGTLIGGITGGLTSYKNYQNSILETQAKAEDLNNTPPTIGAQGNNATFDTGNEIQGLYVEAKTITEENAKILANYFHMFGYKVNQNYNLADVIHTRESFNYVQTINAKFSGNVPHDYLEQIREMFDRGVTLWHTDDVGNYDVENNEL